MTIITIKGIPQTLGELGMPGATSLCKKKTPFPCVPHFLLLLVTAFK